MTRNTLLKGAQQLTSPGLIDGPHLRVLCGTGLAGLAGIPARRGELLRPLLAHSRAALARAVAEVGLHAVADPTNQSLAPPRNRLRHGMFGTGFHRSGVRQELVRRDVRCRPDRGDTESSGRQRAGLVERHDANSSQTFEMRAPFDEHSVSCGCR